MPLQSNRELKFKTILQGEYRHHRSTRQEWPIQSHKSDKRVKISHRKPEALQGFEAETNVISFVLWKEINGNAETY